MIIAKKISSQVALLSQLIAKTSCAALWYEVFVILLATSNKQLRCK